MLGGGSGCRAFNDFIRENLDELLRSFQILHLCGKGNVPNFSKNGYLALEYVRDMGGAYACADFVLSRAGSNTLYELIALKKPSLLVPLEKSSRGDQAENARYFEQQNLCRVASERLLSSHGVVALNELARDSKLRENLQRSHIANGTENIVKILKKRLNLC